MSTTVADPIAKIKSKIVDQFAAMIDAYLDPLDAQSSAVEVEATMWEVMLPIMNQVLVSALALICRQRSLADIAKRGLQDHEWRWRMDDAYRVEVNSTVGTLTLPLFAYRDSSTAVAAVTRTPASNLFPHRRQCRSTPLLLQAESKLAAHFPFEQAQTALHFFTHHAVNLADNTLARHAYAVGTAIDKDWLYKPLDAVKEILRTRATRDRTSGKPLIYIASDAHAIVCYDDEAWETSKHTCNGWRLWCEDAKTGRLIHLGGEYTFAHCQGVEARLAEFIASGYLPVDGDYGDGLVAQIVFLSDGAPWLYHRLASQFEGAVVILDLYHLLKWVAEFSAAFSQAGGRRDVLRQVKNRLHAPPGGKRSSGPRKGHKKRVVELTHAHNHAHIDLEAKPLAEMEEVLRWLQEVRCPSEAARQLRDAFVVKLKGYAPRCAYDSYRRRGIQIGSGAIESLHRQASLVRTRRPGTRWIQDNVLAIINLRMLELVGRWDEFWTHKNLDQILCQAFEPRPDGASTAQPERDAA